MNTQKDMDMIGHNHIAEDLNIGGIFVCRYAFYFFGYHLTDGSTIDIGLFRVVIGYNQRPEDVFPIGSNESELMNG